VINSATAQSHLRTDQSQDGDGGALYHLADLYYALYLALHAWWFETDLAIIDSGTTHYFALTIFRLLGIRVAVNLHNVLWPAGFEPKARIQRIIRQLNSCGRNRPVRLNSARGAFSELPHL
jgi:hypothetical protein